MGKISSSCTLTGKKYLAFFCAKEQFLHGLNLQTSFPLKNQSSVPKAMTKRLKPWAVRNFCDRKKNHDRIDVVLKSSNKEYQKNTSSLEIMGFIKDWSRRAFGFDTRAKFMQSLILNIYSYSDGKRSRTKPSSQPVNSLGARSLMKPLGNARLSIDIL